MNFMSELDFQAYDVPRQDGASLIVPPLSTAANCLNRNTSAANRTGATEDWLSEFRVAARTQTIRDALSYTGSYRSTVWADPLKSAPVVMAGHQPTLFHPGVWLKNFALDRLGTINGWLPINLVVDNDVGAGSSIRVPHQDPTSGLVSAVSVPYDDAGGGLPYEQTRIVNRELFESFDQRVVETLGNLVSQPTVNHLWPHAKEAISRCGFAGCAFAQARHVLEAELGLHTLEVPLSVVAKGEGFARFAHRILSQLDRFQACYNESTQLYRRLHGIRSAAHPVPNLGREGQWLEAPLWMYSDAAPERRAAWVRIEGNWLHLSNRRGLELRLPHDDPMAATEIWRHQSGDSLKTRPRALLTTMYSRLVLSDLFLHGIGGGKYDQLSNVIMRRFFRVQPPQFMVMSATVQLEATSERSVEPSVARIKHVLRDTQFHPEVLAEADTQENSVLIRRKQALLTDVPENGKKAWHDELTSINLRLSDSLSKTRRQLQQDLAAAKRREASTTYLNSREHSFCIHPLHPMVQSLKSHL
ncbi:MAG: hypothetical protein AAGA03_19530 [Planctomycetota bacterium]